MTPRSILKPTAHRTSTAPQQSVHFPPSPSLCSTYQAYSPAAYDRSPIVVSKNTCALPERGGRTYILDDPAASRSSPRQSRSPTSRSYHPRAMADGRGDVPHLIPDVSSSSSDESDGFNPSPTGFYGQPPSNYYSYGAHGLPTKYETPVYTPSNESTGDIHPLSFLPYPPSPPAHDERSRRRTRQHDMNDLERMRAANSSNSSTEEERVVCSSSKKRSSSRRREYLNKLAASGSAAGLCNSFGAVSLQDDGCLGGF